MGLLVVWTVYLSFWGLVMALLTYVEQTGWKGWLKSMGFMVFAGVIITLSVYGGIWPLS